jgi:hypothetical protein
MSDPRRNEELRETCWRRPLTPAEATEWKALRGQDAGAEEDARSEMALSTVLRDLQDAPLASNFTARVLREVERKNVSEARRRNVWLRLWHRRARLLPRLAWGTALVCVGLLSFHQTVDYRRGKMVESVKAVAEVASLPSPEILENFEAIRALDAPPKPDEDLLRLFE